MMMARRDLRVIPFTRHVPIAQVPAGLTPARLETCVRVTDEALRRDFKIPRPRIEVAGLNPHAGEDGVIGNEDRDIIAPVVERLRRQKIDVSGPWPADDVSVRAAGRGAAGRTSACRARNQAILTPFGQHDRAWWQDACTEAP
jgi:4-hydroxythreonine-4-phosphate dehydrogenase